MGSLLSRGQQWREEMDLEAAIVVTADARVGVYLSVRVWRGVRVALTCPLAGLEATGALLLRALSPLAAFVHPALFPLALAALVHAALLLPPRYAPGGLSRWWHRLLRQLDGEESVVLPADDDDASSWHAPVFVPSLSL